MAGCLPDCETTELAPAPKRETVSAWKPPSLQTYEKVCGGSGGGGNRSSSSSSSHFVDTATLLRCDFAERMSKQGSYYTPQSMQ